MARDRLIIGITDFKSRFEKNITCSNFPVKPKKRGGYSIIYINEFGFRVKIASSFHTKNECK